MAKAAIQNPAFYDEDKARELFESGRAAAEKFLRSWDFEDYKRKFRSGGPAVTRRSAVTGAGDRTI